MINQSTINSLKAMKLTTMATELEHQLEDTATYRTLAFEDRLGLLVDAKWNCRQATKLIKYINNIHYSAPNATIKEIEYYESRRLDKAEILRLATCQYIQSGHHIILKGAYGNGKIYLACAFWHAPCRKFTSMKYSRMPKLLVELNVAKGYGRLKKTINSYQKVELLILNEWLIRTLAVQEVYDLLEIIEAQCEKSPIIFRTQYEPAEWYNRINPDPNSDSPIFKAIMDRIIHNSYELLIEGKVFLRERHPP